MPPPRIVVSPNPRDLRDIAKADCNLAIWQRPAFIGEAALRGAVRSGMELAIETETAIGRREDIAALLPDERAHPAFSREWRADVCDLVILFASLARGERVRLRLETVRGSACRLFHADYVTLRLLCTYVGRGTEYLEEDNTERSELGKGRNAAVVRDPGQVRRLRTHDVGLFKGRQYPGNADLGIVHRSPPASARTPRLLLCLDVADC